MPVARDGLLLALDASTYAGSAALVRGTSVVAECTVAMRGEREERLMPAIAAMLEDGGYGAESLEAVVCGSGPGSFTSLRIAASIAKGLAVALDRPLFTVPSMLLVVAGAVPSPSVGRYAVLLDAMRGELYAVTVAVEDALPPRLVSALEIIAANDSLEYAASARAVPIGPGVGSGTAPHARGVARLWTREPAANTLVAVDVDAWEPYYGRLAEAQVRWEAAHGRALPPG